MTLDQLKTELREFIALSETITPGEWTSYRPERSNGFYYIDHKENQQVAVCYSENSGQNATFIARSRNISPAMAECLLVAIDTALDCESWDADLRKMYLRPDAERVLQQILNLWESSK
jgi:hypothetical protein